MSKAKIFYFTLQDEQTKEEKLDWFERTRFEQIPFDHITPDKKTNWINLTDNDFDSFLPLIDKVVKAGKSQEAVFQLFSAGVKTQRDEWAYDWNEDDLIEKIKFLLNDYQASLKKGNSGKSKIKWDENLESCLARRIQKEFDRECIRNGMYRPFVKKKIYFDSHLNGRTYQMSNIFRTSNSKNTLIWLKTGDAIPFWCLASSYIADLTTIGGSQCLPLYRYDENGNRIDNITDWGLTQFQTHYSDPTITKEAIFHYTYAVLHHPAYRTKYELNLKREFPRLPFYSNFHQWATWGRALMDLHLNYEAIEPYGLTRHDIASKANPKAKLKADKTHGTITLDENTQLSGVPPIAWDYKLGNRSALEWILDQYKEKKPKDPTIAKLFNTYKFADYKEQVIDLLDRVCTVSVRTIEIIQQMPDTVEHQGG
ncbi:hypothetical protein L3556_04135 [Candidatus Synechococcus calcipolaris G9]|uniref:Type ISP restriction-modification enzyme LLaBIII C-terminal specificity domain-containing protein n=1 Tax=Candidatus Synechococcus calcipolaris G9 TaxID=1497997 RepID=A0ABT6EXN4_9SYNE|nr:type ISP restriction/modification enzyme [Candidatus Synechococcus calcipolaris]MDG2990127.1 hypothetical protein [Candidatus Synechococcus calcipolaris G9]